jgi:hypothetical protein
MGFVPGSTPFGTFDYDPEFQADADRLVQYVREKLGDPTMAVHIQSSSIYASFEEACFEYSAIVNQYQAKSVLASFLGANTGSLSGSENTFSAKFLSLAQRMSEPYSEEARMNSNTPLYSGSVGLVPGVQKYDLQVALSQSGQITVDQRITLSKLYYFNPISAYRFFGTTSAINYLNNEFSFESFTPETIFYLLPIWEDILRGMQFKTSNNVRRSNYSYELHNNVLTIYPMPVDTLNLYFEYTLPGDPTEPQSPSDADTFFGVSNLSNIPFGNITYSKVNSMGHRWIQRFAFSLAKETEGHIRGKMTSIPIPNGELTLNGPELISDAKEEQQALREELKTILEETTYQNLMKMEADMRQSIEETWKGSPLAIYIG